MLSEKLYITLKIVRRLVQLHLTDGRSLFSDDGSWGDEIHHETQHERRAG